MSLSILNSPPLVTKNRTDLGYTLPYIQDMIKTSPWSAVHVANLVTYYGINVISVSRPGRMDVKGAKDGEVFQRN